MFQCIHTFFNLVNKITMMNEENLNTNQLIFRAKWWGLIILAVISLVILVGLGMYISQEPSIQWEDILSWNKWFSIIIYVLFMIYCMLSYFVNKKSYIELTDTHLIVVKPMHYPFPAMENLTIPYNDIQLFKIILAKNGYCAYINVKQDFWKTKTIRFYCLDNVNKLNEELIKKWVKTEFRSSGWNTPPEL